MKFLKKANDNTMTKPTKNATKIDGFFFLILHLLFPGNLSAKLREQSRPSRVRVKTVLKKKRREVILRELSVRDVDLLANRYHLSTPSHISPSLSVIDNNRSKRRHMHATNNNEKGT